MGERADSFLDGRVKVEQPPSGFRSGTDAVLLAAAVPAREGETLLEPGSGAGVASLCVAARIPRCRIVGVEIGAGLVSLANENSRRNRMAARISFICADVFDLPRGCRRSFDHVFLNPPFHGNEGMRSSSRERARALHDEGRLKDWLEASFKRVSAGGTLTAIIRSDRLDEAFQALPARGMVVFPLWPRANEPAKRVILQIRKNARAPFALLAGLALHDATGRYTPDAEDVLRGRTSLALATPRR
ncbi:MAG: tRNA1(Val) (adenine(37)-N6)-methyltransferase [Rhizomicrobium sp.]